ncbi:MAG: hypothetical protein Q8N92_02025 [Erysipelotrichaceae bacterium]|nr:hypothetical protein [Erysipelotrichaceae bacterium]
MRTINERFINDLQSQHLKFFLQEVKNNQNLCLEVRRNYINIYYRGGNLLKIEQQKKGYTFEFDSRYCLNKGNDANHVLLDSLSKKDASLYEKHFKLMISEMDEWFLLNPKAEREFQHHLLIANKNIIDIEYQFANSSRFDTLMLHENKLIIVEIKYGSKSISRGSGLAKHYLDICNAISDDKKREELWQSANFISDAKYKLGLRASTINLTKDTEIEILFIFANYNKKSKTISNEIKLINKQYDAKILFMEKDETVINYNAAEDLFSYGS